MAWEERGGLVLCPTVGRGGGGDQMTHQEAKLGEGQGVLMRGEYQGRAQLRS